VLIRIKVLFTLAVLKFTNLERITINLNLLPDDSPRWHLTIGMNKAPTLRPSVWRREGCAAHFFLRGGRIAWC
jgi:hypothetical protein